MRSIIFICLIFFIGCSSNSKISVKDHSMYWHKNSAEFKALCLQAYNVATKNLDIQTIGSLARLVLWHTSCNDKTS